MGSDERIRKSHSSSSQAVHVGTDTGCEEWSQQVTLLVDGELDDVDCLETERHLNQCRPCQAAVHYRRAFREALRTKLSGSVIAHPGDVKERIRAALAAEPQPVIAAAPPEPPPGQRRRTLKRLWAPVPVAAAGATALGITAWIWFSSSHDDVVRDLVARHARQLPLEIQSNDPRSLQQWLNGKVDFRVKIPTPRNQPLSLVGARLSHVRDHAAVHLLYGTTQSPQHQVSMLVYDDPSHRPVMAGNVRRIDNQDVYIANRAGYNVAMWKDNEVVYSLVSDTEDDVLELVRAANR